MIVKTHNLEEDLDFWMKLQDRENFFRYLEGLLPFGQFTICDNNIHYGERAPVLFFPAGPWNAPFFGNKPIFCFCEDDIESSEELTFEDAVIRFGGFGRGKRENQNI